MTPPKSTVSADLSFALVPEWLLDTDVSAQALRLYAVLSRYADTDGNAFPSRKLLAERMRVSSRKTVDRCLKELVAVRAVSVRGRADEAGDQTSNHYLVHRVPAGVAPFVSPPRATSDATGGHEGPDGGDTDVPTVGTQMSHEREPLEREPLEREEPLLVAAAAPTPATPEPELREDVERLCILLADRIEANGSKRPTITKAWRTAARLLLDRDERTEDQVVRCINWCQDDEFWRANILSMPKLRKQYDQLRQHALRDQRARTAVGESRAAAWLDLGRQLADQQPHGPAPPPTRSHPPGLTPTRPPLAIGATQ